jgi:hypothetical protein
MNDNVHKIELELEDAHKKVETMEALARLRKNQDFKDLIEEGYFKGEAARIVALKADPNFIMAGELQMKVLDTLEAGVGGLQAHFRLIDQQGRMAAEALDEMEETREQVLREDAIGSGEEVL